MLLVDIVNDNQGKESILNTTTTAPTGTNRKLEMTKKIGMNMTDEETGIHLR